MSDMASCDVTGHHLQVKDLVYTVHKCSLCKKRCLFRTRKMVKCIVCKCVMHRRCISAANRQAPSTAATSETAVRVTDLTTVHRSPHPTVTTVDDAESQAAGDRGSGSMLIVNYTLVRINDNGTLDVTMKVELRIGEEQHVVMGSMLGVAKEMWYELSGQMELCPAKDENDDDEEGVVAEELQ